jgi:adenosylhomocysteine nucleosidase
MSEKKIAIIAAMEREVWPLIRRWKVRTIEHAGRQCRLFENVFANGEAALICGGIGAEAARRATEAIIREVSPTRALSVGFAGALDPSLRVGDVLEPRTVINAADSARIEIESGEGSLVTSATIASKDQKTRLAKSYSAAAVDMEAAAVAQGAAARGVEFAALKAISDAVDFNMPARMDRFVAADGKFRSAKFAIHVALRPWLWASTIALARNSAKASRALCNALATYLDRETRDRSLLRNTQSVSGMNSIDFEQADSNQARNEPSAGAHTSTSTHPHPQVTGTR